MHGRADRTFFDRSSRSAEASGIWSASSFFSLAFSSSKAFRCAFRKSRTGVPLIPGQRFR
ncbi:hypothetical protein EB234_30300 [Mesorhizobium japonicum R7A]|uniref:Uncharacterized protein n=1 Tax=Mesorhizobium loti R88b TaxID=935548 RepID=A0A6M7WZ14_RHILI|nr:hypothetical protein EB234_30300 [Mesorhizobium japonicum R7A]QKD05749.1 hypothetical protein EB235_33365 [Mesorhizobium loti R88b]